MNKKNDSLYKRNERIFFLYQYYLLGVNFNKKISFVEHNFNSNQIEFIDNILKNKNILEEKIHPFLPKDWKWERINFIEKAIILNAVAEITLFKNSKKIIINESVNFAKQYGELNSYSLINAILDNF